MFIDKQTARSAVKSLVPLKVINLMAQNQNKIQSKCTCKIYFT